MSWHRDHHSPVEHHPDADSDQHRQQHRRTRGLADRARLIVEAALGRFGERITRVEVHLSDENGDKSSRSDKRCVMEARLAGRQPIAVTDEGATVNEALDGAAGKLTRLIDTTLGRLGAESRHRTDSWPSALDAAEQL